MLRSMLVRFFLLNTLVSLAACGASRSYALPVSASEARSTWAPIKFAASQRGYTAVEMQSMVRIAVDDVTDVDFWITQRPEYVMQVVIDDKKVAPGELEAKFLAGKAIGDAIWADAMKARRETGTIVLVR